MSQSDQYCRCLCQNCGGSIEFPREGSGSTVSCPHCKWSTVLVADGVVEAVSAHEAPTPGKRGVSATLIVAFVLIAAGGGAAFWFLGKGRPSSIPPPAAVAEPVRAETPPPKPVAPVPPPDPWHGLMAGPISIEKAPNSHLVYAVGELRNTSNRERFGVKVELDVLDADNDKIGTATDYADSIDPGKKWKFKALVTDRAAVAAKLAVVKEN